MSGKLPPRKIGLGFGLGLGLRLVVNRRLGCKLGTLFCDLVVNRRHNGILDVNRGPFIIEFS